MRTRVLHIVFCALLAGALSIGQANVIWAASDDWDIPGGHFYTQAGDGRGGYAITDQDGIPFWTAFQQLGGVPALGYPASRRYARGSFVYQVTQAALLQWNPETRQVELANVFEMLEQAERDPWLLSLGIPPPIRDDGSNGDFARAVATRLGWLTDPAIAAAYQGPTAALDLAIARYGLPSSQPQRFGPFVAQRFQRAALQHWVETVPGMPPPGTVVPVLAGDLLKQAGLVPADAAIPVPVVLAETAAQFVIRDPHIVDVLDTLRQTTRGTSLEGDANGVLDLTSRRGVEIGYQSLPDRIYGTYRPASNTIALATAIRGEDPRAIAAVLYHELSHAYDLWAGQLGPTPEECLNSEYRAFQRQARYWQQVAGPAGRIPPRTPLEVSLNDIVQAVFEHPVRFVLELIGVYETECA
ncbi:MAG: hypothetical protein HYY04_10155 [Chloroflexi bacterium]|nr:hypothetical protein [Chloroflexota bacterium]